VKVRGKPRVTVIYNRDFEGAEADPENKARDDIKEIADNIVAVLTRHGYPAMGLGITGDIPLAIRRLAELAPSVVFNLCESIRGDNRFESLLPLFLDLEGIPYTGSGPFPLSLALHKHKAKEILCARGVPTPAAVLLEGPDTSGVSLDFPLIVKPAREDASVGICSASVVRDRQALDERVGYVLDHYRQPALVEQYIEGREIYVSLLERCGQGPQIFPFFEIDFSEMPSDRPRIVSFEGKWVQDSVEYRGTKPVRCEGLSPALRSRVAETALAAFEAIGLRDYARVDIRLAPDGIPYVIDVNPNCDLSDIAGGFSKAARAGGLSYEDVVLRLVELALSRRIARRGRVRGSGARASPKRAAPQSGPPAPAAAGRGAPRKAAADSPPAPPWGPAPRSARRWGSRPPGGVGRGSRPRS
jgi:D-alanine-D-alanine ligase